MKHIKLCVRVIAHYSKIKVVCSECLTTMRFERLGDHFKKQHLLVSTSTISKFNTISGNTKKKQQCLKQDTTSKTKAKNFNLFYYMIGLIRRIHIVISDIFMGLKNRNFLPKFRRPVFTG